MSGFSVRQNQHRKVTGFRTPSRAAGSDERLTAIITVNVDGYIPVYVDLRSRISADMFTAEFNASLLGRLERDPAVKSVAVSEKLHIIE